MDKFYKTVVGAVTSASSLLFGGLDGLMITLLCLSLFDQVTGLLASAYQGRLSSKIGYKAIIRKIGIFVVIAMCHILDTYIIGDLVQGVINVEYPLRSLAIIFYISLEGISNVENLAVFMPLPSWLKKLFESMKEKGEGK